MTIAAGCSTVSVPWIESDSAQTRSTVSGKHVAVIGELTNPTGNPLGWTDIGRKLSENIRARIGQRKDIEANDDASLAARVGAAIALPDNHRAAELKAVARQWPQVRYVLTGGVVEFRHATQGPAELSQSSSAASRNRAQAIVAMKVDIVDLHQRRVIASERIEARAWADQSPLEQTYRGVTFGTQRFWSTPLGLASRDAIARCADRFDVAAPPVVEPPVRIVSRLSERRVRLNIGSTSRVQAGDVLFVCEYDASGTRLQPVFDPATRQPVKAKVESRGVLPSAWLLGEPPERVNLTRTVLLASLPG